MPTILSFSRGFFLSTSLQRQFPLGETTFLPSLCLWVLSMIFKRRGFRSTE
jgi:hypothetical protein